MIDYEAFVRIKHLPPARGLEGPSQIAAALDLDERTVREMARRKTLAARERRGLSPKQTGPLQSLYHPPPGDPSLYGDPGVSKDPREEGFNGGYTIVKDYVHKVRPRKTPAFLKLSFAPGECAQVIGAHTKRSPSGTPAAD